MLDEIRWNLDWMLSMQDADGGVWHKQTSEGFAGFVMPQDDPSVSVVIGTGSEPFKSTCATADFAAVMAIASRVYQPYDAAYATRTLEAAKRARTWAEAHPGVPFQNPAGVVTGGYGDGNCGDELLWAAAELWRSAGDEGAQRWFLAKQAGQRGALKADGPPGWGNVAPMALWSYALAAKGDAAVQDGIRRESLAAADAIVARSAAHGYRISLTKQDYVWGSNSVAANYGLQLLVANAMKKDARYVDAARDNLHYLLGRNTFSLSWLTQVGANPFRHPHHRPSGADANAEPWPGLLSGGPNGRKQDAEMRKLPDGLPPAKMYVDEQGSYASNENAINWNAALVFLLAGAADDCSTTARQSIRFMLAARFSGCRLPVGRRPARSEVPHDRCIAPPCPARRRRPRPRARIPDARGATSLVAAPATTPDPLAATLDAMLAKLYPADAPGAAVIAVRDGRTVLRKAYGMADLELGVPLQPDMVFRIGSMTKQFTAVAILMLVRGGQARGLRPDHEVPARLPDRGQDDHRRAPADPHLRDQELHGHAGLPRQHRARTTASRS